MNTKHDDVFVDFLAQNVTPGSCRGHQPKLRLKFTIVRPCSDKLFSTHSRPEKHRNGFRDLMQSAESAQLPEMVPGRLGDGFDGEIESQTSNTNTGGPHSQQDYPQSKHRRCCGNYAVCHRRKLRVLRSTLRQLKLWHWLLLVLLCVVTVGLALCCFIHRIALLKWLQRVTVILQRHRLQGYLVLMSATIVTAFPPMPGYSLCCYAAGYAFGLRGFIPVYLGAVVGSALCFALFRYCFAKCMRTWIENNKWYASCMLIYLYNSSTDVAPSF